MARIFISYAHEDQAAAKRIVDALAREGLDAWWDHEIPPGRSWDEVIGGRIAKADVVIVIWSQRSVGSNFVKEEAQLAHDAGKLLPVRIEDVEPPVGFRRVHAANLIGWRGQQDHAQWRSMLSEVGARLNAPMTPRPSAPRSAPRASNGPLLLAVAAAIVVLGGGAYFVLSQPTGPAVPTPAQTADTSPANAPNQELEPASISSLVTTTAAPAASHQSPSPPPTTTTSARAAPPVDARAVELQFWRSCCDGSGVSADDYRSYLGRYSNGEFAYIALQRLAALERPPPPAVPSLANTTWAGRITVSSDSTNGCWNGPSTLRFLDTSNATLDGLVGNYTRNGNQLEVTFPEGRFSGTISGTRITGTYSYNLPNYSCRGAFEVSR